MIPYSPSPCWSRFYKPFRHILWKILFALRYTNQKVFQRTYLTPDPFLLTFLIEHCLTPKKVGWCRGSFPRWFYNPSLEQCEEFIFGGCKPNKNNYLREEECELACKNVRGESFKNPAPSFS